MAVIMWGLKSRERERESRGIPIGNLTSQIFANIYLNELVRLVKHRFKVKGYLRYGDDFIVIEKDKVELTRIREEIIDFLITILRLTVNPKNDIIIKATAGLKFLGVKIYPHGRKLSFRNWQRVSGKMNLNNIASYRGLVSQHGTNKQIKQLNWQIKELL